MKATDATVTLGGAAPSLAAIPDDIDKADPWHFRNVLT